MTLGSLAPAGGVATRVVEVVAGAPPEDDLIVVTADATAEVLVVLLLVLVLVLVVVTASSLADPAARPLEQAARDTSAAAVVANIPSRRARMPPYSGEIPFILLTPRCWASGVVRPVQGPPYLP